MSVSMCCCRDVDLVFSPSTVRPLNVTIMGMPSYLSAGTEYELVCQSWGSRPSAIISWWKGGTTALKDALMTVSVHVGVGLAGEYYDR